MTAIEIQNKLAAAHRASQSSLFPLIKSRTHQHFPYPERCPQESLWTAHWWKLERSATYNALPEAQRQTVLRNCNRMLLNEAYFIEKSGLAYCAKMVLLAESTDAAQVYSLIGADEAKHLAWIEPYVLEEDKMSPYGDFLSFLSQLIETAPANTLAYLVQIILEGWGLDHYRRMASGCQQTELSDILNHIVKDEALHHRSGNILFDGKKLSGQETAQIDTALRRYCDMVRIGPASVLEAVSAVTGKLAETSVIDICQAVDHVGETQRKLALLKSLMRQPGLEAVVDHLEQSGYFCPMPIGKVVAWYTTQD